MELFFMFITQPMIGFPWISVVAYLKYGFCLSLLLLLFSITQAAAQGESTKISLPRMITYTHNDYSFGVPQDWSVKTTNRDALKTIVIMENPANVNRSPTLLRLEMSSSSTSPQDLVRRFIGGQGFENLTVINEVPQPDGYLVLVEWTDKNKRTGKGLFFAYKEGDSDLVLIGFSAPRERFESLGGSALPITVFSNPWIKLEKASHTN
jgi:hypothetical protein